MVMHRIKPRTRVDNLVSEKRKPKKSYGRIIYLGLLPYGFNNIIRDVHIASLVENRVCLHRFSYNELQIAVRW